MRLSVPARRRWIFCACFAHKIAARRAKTKVSISGSNARKRHHTRHARRQCRERGVARGEGDGEPDRRKCEGGGPVEADQATEEGGDALPTLEAQARPGRGFPEEGPASAASAAGTPKWAPNDARPFPSACRPEASLPRCPSCPCAARWSPPIFPEPMPRRSGSPASRVRTMPNGMEPSR